LISSQTKNTFVLLSLGANIGDRIATLENAIAMLGERGVLSQIVKSSYYRTEPYGVKNQDWFVNVCLSGFTELSPLQLLEQCKKVEKLFGRQVRERWHERELDIDIIFYGDEIVNTDYLTIPHREYKMRNFVLAPAAEICGSFVPPDSELTINQLASNCEDTSKVEIIN
jgi:2-amino-4-hydroxy-6-hydroxymethyldihydropteridine diphosphokinase